MLALALGVTGDHTTRMTLRTPRRAEFVSFPSCFESLDALLIFTFACRHGYASRVPPIRSSASGLGKTKTTADRTIGNENKPLQSNSRKQNMFEAVNDIPCLGAAIRWTVDAVLRRAQTATHRLSNSSVPSPKPRGPG